MHVTGLEKQHSDSSYPELLPTETANNPGSESPLLARFCPTERKFIFCTFISLFCSLKRELICLPSSACPDGRVSLNHEPKEPIQAASLRHLLSGSPGTVEARNQ